MKLNNHTRAKYVCPNCGKGYDGSQLCEVCTGVGESGPEYPYVETVPVSIQDDIEQLRSAFEYDLINQDLKQPINRVCDALEAAQKDIAVLSENLAVSNAAAVDLGAKLEASLKRTEYLEGLASDTQEALDKEIAYSLATNKKLEKCIAALNEVSRLKYGISANEIANKVLCEVLSTGGESE